MDNFGHSPINRFVTHLHQVNIYSMPVAIEIPPPTLKIIIIAHFASEKDTEVLMDLDSGARGGP